MDKSALQHDMRGKGSRRDTATSIDGGRVVLDSPAGHGTVQCSMIQYRGSYFFHPTQASYHSPPALAFWRGVEGWGGVVGYPSVR